MLTLLALDSMLRETFSVNCISPTLDSNGIDWANIHGPSKFVFPSGFHLSNELVIELETFRSKEHEKPGFLSEWLSRLQGKAVVASECMKSVRSVMKTYKGLYKARDGAKLSAFLKEEFKSGEKHVPTASVSMLPLSKTPQEKQSECEPHNLILQLQKTREEKEMEVMEKNKLEKKAEHLDYVLDGAEREIKLQTLEKAALSRAKEQALSSLQKAQAELKKHQKEKKSSQSKTVRDHAV